MRTNGEGTLYRVTRKDGTQVWRAQRTVYITEDGRQVRVSGEGATRELALERVKAAELRMRVRQGVLGPEALMRTPSELKVTVEDWMYRWHGSLGNRVGEQTKANYLSKIRLHICGVDGIGSTPIRLLTADQVNDFIWKTLPNKKNPKTGEQLLGNTTLKQIYTILSQALDAAVKARVINYNPCDAVDAPRRTPPKNEGVAQLKSWLPDHLLGKLEGDPELARWTLAFYGLRQSEVLGLTDDCIVWGTGKGKDKYKNAYIIIQQQLARHPSQHGCGRYDASTKSYPCGKRNSNECPKMLGKTGLYIKNTTKTQSSTREIPLVEPLYSVLQEHMKRQRELRQSPQFQPQKGDKMDKLVFTTVTGKPRRHQDDNEAWRKLLERSNVPHIRGHIARHISVSILASMGYDMDTIMRITGWSSTAMKATYNWQSRNITREPLEKLGMRITSRQKASKKALEQEKQSLELLRQKIEEQRRALEEQEAELAAELRKVEEAVQEKDDV